MLSTIITRVLQGIAIVVIAVIIVILLIAVSAWKIICITRKILRLF